jgi:adenosine deaminase
LAKEPRDERIPLTVCALSNVELHAFDSAADHDGKRLLGSGLCLSVNSTIRRTSAAT